MLRIYHHRRSTANHTWYVDLAGNPLFVKANPNPAEAVAERNGHTRLRPHYPVPALRGTRRIGRWTLLAYDRWPHLGANHGLQLDIIATAELSGNRRNLDGCLTDLIDHYRAVIDHTVRYATATETVAKLYADRAAPGGRLDHYYGTDALWHIGTDPVVLRPSELAAVPLVVNEREHLLDLNEVITRLRAQLRGMTRVWAAITQGDPTDLNIGWTPAGGAVWFDYDTAGLNALAGEIACFLIYQRLHGAWLTPRYNRAAFRDHPAALRPSVLDKPFVHTRKAGRHLVIEYQHTPSATRRHILRRYLGELVEPLAHALGVVDVMHWLRSYLLMRLLAVFNLSALDPRDTALSLALVTEAMHPDATFAGIARPHPRDGRSPTAVIRLRQRLGSVQNERCMNHMAGVVIWMRHGSCADGHPLSKIAHARFDSPLTPNGIQEAYARAYRLRAACPRPVYVTSSPLPRARHTAEIVADVLSVPLRPAEDTFSEWRAPSCVLGLTPAEYPAEYRAWRQVRLSQPDSALPGGESLAAFARRAKRAIDVAGQAEDASPLLVVSHRLLIGAVAAIRLGHRNPPAIFTHAVGFALAPAEPWTAESGRPATKLTATPRPARPHGWPG